MAFGGADTPEVVQMKYLGRGRRAILWGSSGLFLLYRDWANHHKISLQNGACSWDAVFLYEGSNQINVGGFHMMRTL